jgi:hypothetical protein
MASWLRVNAQGGINDSGLVFSDTRHRHKNGNGRRLLDFV